MGRGVDCVAKLVLKFRQQRATQSGVRPFDSVPVSQTILTERTRGLTLSESLISLGEVQSVFWNIPVLPGREIGVTELLISFLESFESHNEFIGAFISRDQLEKKIKPYYVR